MEKLMRLTLGILVVAVSLGGCVSLESYDEWVAGEHEAENQELDSFDDLRDDYPHIVDFSSEADRDYVIEESGAGTVSDGRYIFANDTAREFTHYKIDIAALESDAGKRISSIAVLLLPYNRGGFVEIWPRYDLPGGNPNSVNDSGIRNGQWSLLEFEIDDGKTVISGSGFNKVLPRTLDNISVFCFNGSRADLDYILFE